jgi:hypothetical protein
MFCFGRFRATAVLLPLLSSGLGTLVGSLAREFPQDTVVQSYEDEIRAWHERRITNLKREHGWLSLVALNWLSEGKNSIPAIGTLTLEKGKAQLDLGAGAQASIDGKLFASSELRVAGDPGGPDKVVIGSRAFVIIEFLSFFLRYLVQRSPRYG